MKYFLLWGFIICGMTAPAWSQQNSCGSDEYYQLMLKQHPEYAKAEKEMNQKAQNWAKSPQKRAALFTIPVVFHVIHTNGPENISRDQILDQLRILNNDFSFKNWNKNKIRSQFSAVAADCQIQFKLATVDPSGNCTDGINRIYNTAGIEVDMNTEPVKNLIYWDKTKYLNIWVVTSIASQQVGATTLGYAVFPWMSNRDGVVVRSDRVGSIGTASQSDSGRTLTHEVGHWLGLYHTFQGGCNDDDLCTDTPPVATSTTNANCPASGNSCSNDNPNLPDQWENYMDYSDGKCMAMFSLQQKSRMHYFLTAGNPNNRSSNVSATNLVNTGITAGNTAPTPYFVSSQRVVCAGVPIKFYDVSCKAVPTARSWTFTGSSTPSSSDAAPVVVYQTPGKYPVSLTVQNAKGTSTPLTIADYITVVDRSSALLPNKEEAFESDPSSRGFAAASPSPYFWSTTNTAAFGGSQSYKAPVKNTDALGAVYSFTTPPYKLSVFKGGTVRITFYCAYAPAYTTSTETLRLYVSTDCGNSFTQILERTGTGLSYPGAPVTANFMPTAKNQWKLMGVPSLGNLGYDTLQYAIFRIDVISDKGNPVYIDNLNIGEYFSGVKYFDKNALKAAVYPNPAKGSATLELITIASTKAKIELYDMAGRLVKTIFNGTLNQGIEKLEITDPSSGNGSLYLIRVTTLDGQITKPITFAP
jgi:PKD repeat protein